MFRNRVSALVNCVLTLTLFSIFTESLTSFWDGVAYQPTTLPRIAIICT